jgi:hypothetical protein
MDGILSASIGLVARKDALALVASHASVEKSLLNFLVRNQKLILVEGFEILSIKWLIVDGHISQKQAEGSGGCSNAFKTRAFISSDSGRREGDRVEHRRRIVTVILSRQNLSREATNGGGRSKDPILLTRLGGG